jgi:cell wall-associated NlpC family hydrolase
MTAHDRRLTAARPDLAALHLAGEVIAERYVPATPMRVAEPAVALRAEPSTRVSLDTQALFGEIVNVYDITPEGWAWGQLEVDGYVGWMPADALAEVGPAASHRVSAVRAFVFPEATFKAPIASWLTMNARVAVSGFTETRGRLYAALASGGFVPAHQVTPIDATPESDPVAVAERFLETPYLWGGRTSMGLDCSGLVQAALHACGIACPRDSDMQETIGAEVSRYRTDWLRGDLLLWDGHVAFVRDAHTLLHANAKDMKVAIEDLSSGLARIEASGTPLKTVRRVAR